MIDKKCLKNWLKWNKWWEKDGKSEDVLIKNDNYINYNLVADGIEILKKKVDIQTSWVRGYDWFEIKLPSNITLIIEKYIFLWKHDTS